jgi:hypothetical protein
MYAPGIEPRFPVISPIAIVIEQLLPQILGRLLISPQYIQSLKIGRPCHNSGFPPRRPEFEPRSSHVGFVVDKVALGQVFSEYFGFPCQFAFRHRLLLTHHLSSVACTIGQTAADVPSGPQETKKN